MSEAEAAARGSGAGTSRWLFRRGSLPLLTAVAAALALGLHLAGWLHDPPTARSPDDGATTGDTDDMAAPSAAGLVGSIPAGTSRPTLHRSSPLRRAAAAPGKDMDAPAAPGRPPTSSLVARHAAALYAGDPSGALGPEPAAGPDGTLEPAAAASPGAPGPTQAGAVSPRSDAVAAPSDGAAVAAPVACPTSVEGLEDVAADLVARRARFDEREMALLLRAAALEEAERRLTQRAAELDDVVKTGRTHLMDAMPVRMGQEIGGWAYQVAQSIERIEICLPRLAKLALGGTAVGTGINAHPEFASRVAQKLAERTGIPFVESDNHFAAQSAMDTATELSAHLKTTATARSSPSRASGIAKANACATSGCSRRTSSISRGEIFSPPRLMISLRRPVSRR